MKYRLLSHEILLECRVNLSPVISLIVHIFDEEKFYKCSVCLLYFHMYLNH